jgi:hypothetical protein
MLDWAAFVATETKIGLGLGSLIHWLPFQILLKGQDPSPEGEMHLPPIYNSLDLHGELFKFIELVEASTTLVQAVPFQVNPSAQATFGRSCLQIPPSLIYPCPHTHPTPVIAKQGYDVDCP